MPNVFGSDGPAVRSKDNREASGHSWARPVTPDLLCVHEVRVDLASDVAFQDAHDLACGTTFGDPARDIFAGAFIATHARERDPPQGMVRLAVPTGVQAMTVDFPRRRPQGRDATQMRERRFAFQPVRVVARGDQQDRGGVDTDTMTGEQRGCGCW